MRLTSRGKAASGAAIALWCVAFVRVSLVAASAAFLITLALAWGVATLRDAEVRATRTLSRERISEGEAVVEHLRVSAHELPWTRIHLEEASSVELEAQGETRFTLTGRREVARELRWQAAIWGRGSVGPLRALVHDPFSLLVHEMDVGAPVPVVVQPSPLPLGKYAARASNPEPALGVHSVSRPGDGPDFFALREYAPGDSIRRINWKASARAGTTIVSQASRDTFARALILADLREKEALGGKGAARIRNGRAVASLIAYHDRLKDHVTVLVLTDAPRKLGLQRNPRTDELLRELAASSPGGDGSLERALRQNLALIKPRSPVYVVTSGALDAEVGDAIRLVQAMNARPVLVTPAHVPEDDDEGWAVVRRSREDALQEARALGATVIDWQPGQPLEVAFANI